MIADVATAPTPAPTWQRVGKPLLLAGLLGVVVYQAWGQVRDIDVSRLELRWLPALLLAELLSAAALVAGQAVLLGCGRWVPSPGDRSPGPPPMVLTRTMLIATGLSYVVPGGPAVAAAYAARRYRRFGISSSVAAQSQVATAGAAGVALGSLALAGLLVPGAADQAGLDGTVYWVVLIVSAVILAGSIGLLVLVRSSGSRSWMAHSKLVSRVTGCPPPPADAGLPPVLDLRRTAAAAGFTTLSYLFDVGCLVGALAAADVAIPWRSLLLAYGAAQILGLIPLTPGGAGFLETGLGALIVVPTAANGAVALAVLLYRAFSWGLWVLGGGMALLHLRRRQRPAS